MSSLTRIVKSSAVVDDRCPKAAESSHEATKKSLPVIKSRVMNDGWIPESMQPLRVKQDYQDELNRLKVDIAQAKAEIKSYTRELEAVQKEIELAQEFLGSGDESVQRARAMQEKAVAEAEEIIEQAKRRGAEISEEMGNQAYLEGFNKGFEEAKSEYIGQNQPQADQLADMIERISEYEKEQIEQNQRQIVDMVMGISQKIINREVSTDPKVVVDMLYETIDDNKREEFIKITLSSDLMPVQAKAKKEIRELLMGMGAKIDVYTDDDMPPGGCVVETPKGFIDIGISTQLDNISEVLTGG